MQGGMLSVVAHALLLHMPWPVPVHGTPPTVNGTISEAARTVDQPLNPVRVLSAPEVREIYRRTAGALPPVGLNAFRIQGDRNIYVNAESQVYRQAAREPTAFHVLRLAATLLHEQVHETDGEYAARRIQADFVRRRLNALPSSQRRSAHRYWRTLEVRAVSLARIERRDDH